MQKRDIIKDFFHKNNNIVSLSEYIDFCLYSENGFYSSNNAFGKSGHFVTAPEISSAFSVCVAIYLANYILTYHADCFEIIEIGSGNGLFLHEIIKTFKSLNIENTSFTSIEKSKYNRNLLNQKLGNEIDIFDSISSFIDRQNGKKKIFISNELLDSYPIDQYRKNGKNYSKLCVKYDQKTDVLTDDYIDNFDRESLKNFTKTHPNSTNGSFIEYSDSAMNDFNTICDILNQSGGMLLFFDYGYNLECVSQSTIQAINRHSKCSILNLPLETDITHLVNFNIFIQIAKKFHNLKDLFLKTQNNFLIENGLHELIDSYTSNEKSTTEKVKIALSTSRLLEMDNFFALGLFF